MALYPLERLTKLYDSIEQLGDDMWSDDMSDDHDHGHRSDNEEVWSMDQDGVWQPTLEDDADEWEEIDDGGSMDIDKECSLPIVIPPQPLPQKTSISTASIGVVSHSGPHSLRSPDGADFVVPPVVARPQSPDAPTSATDEVVDVKDSASDDSDSLPWKQFDIISSAPPDHAFYASPPSRPSKSFLGRLAREYRVLQSSLPGLCPVTSSSNLRLNTCGVESVLVRAYEDRTDLLRSLIIGPQNTPYEDAPFVIDWMLDSNFPRSPPIAHFLSWTNGNGRGTSRHCRFGSTRISR
jgi:ubiquitin-conjugating enzyme E2 O